MSDIQCLSKLKHSKYILANLRYITYVCEAHLPYSIREPTFVKCELAPSVGACRLVRTTIAVMENDNQK